MMKSVDGSAAYPRAEFKSKPRHFAVEGVEATSATSRAYLASPYASRTRPCSGVKLRYSSSANARFAAISLASSSRRVGGVESPSAVPRA